MRIDDVARIAHEVNAAYCRATGDNSQPKWEDAPDWQRASAVDGVQNVASGTVSSPGDSHRSWLAQKERDGWVYGPVKRPEAKEHPCMVPFDKLPPEQQVKDHLFLAVAKTCLGAQ